MEGRAAIEQLKQVGLYELALYFLRLGFKGVGGPVALLGQMERDLVAERKWLTSEEMRAAVALCSLPGPLTIQAGIYIAYLRGGYRGALACGLAFIIPNLLVVAAMGAVLFHFAGKAELTGIFYGVSPAVIGLMLYSSYRLARLGMEDALQWIVAMMCFIVTVAFETEVTVLFVLSGAIGIMFYGNLLKREQGAPLMALSPMAAPLLAQFPAAGSGPSSLKLLLFFLQTGAFTFGSGLVIVPFLKHELITKYGWLGERQLLIAATLGMIIPEPILITAIVVGYLISGFAGSILATLGIFLPSFLIVLFAATIVARYRGNPNLQGFIKGAYGAAIGTILGACILLEKIAIGDWFTIIIALVSLTVLFFWRVNSVLLLAAAALLGIVAFPILQPAWLAIP